MPASPENDCLGITLTFSLCFLLILDTFFALVTDVRKMVTFIYTQLKSAIRHKEGKPPLSKAEEDEEFNRVLAMEAYDRLQTVQKTMQDATVQANLQPVIVIDGLEKIDYEKKTAKVSREMLLL